MKISLEWLSEYITFLEKNPEHIAAVMTEKVAEVDAVITATDKYKTVVTGKLLSVENIEGSDKLHAGTFDCGKHGIRSIVFGSVFPLREGEVYPIALSGTELPNGMQVKSTKMRGVETTGMVCSEEELGIQYTSEGLLRFPENTALGVPIMEVLTSFLQSIVIGKIEKLSKHPNADKLTLAQVNTGTEIVDIICGGSNLQEGAKVVVAQPGANIWNEIKIKKAKIRDVESNGMICSTEELHIGPSENKEIMILPDEAEVGMSFFDFLFEGDTVLDIENTTITNRPDLFSHIGFAREMVACELAEWKNGYPEKNVSSQKFPKENLPITITIPKATDICPRYMAVSISGVDGKTQSPEWMQERLASCGIRALSALVDITNYVMLEYGTPQHAFDLNRTGKKWNMRLAEKGEKMTTLDGIERALTTDTIVFEDEKNGIFDLCGVMGGKNSGIVPETTDILLHGMSYDPVRIRRTALNVGPRTDASAIFEKTVPLATVETAMQRSIDLILQIFPEAKITSALFDEQCEEQEKRKITVPLELCERIAGVAVAPEEIIAILTDLGFAVEMQKEAFTCTVPNWRLRDIAIPEDVVEEIVRIHGMNTIAAAAPQMEMRSFSPSSTRQLERNIASTLTARQSCFEILTLAFLGEKLLQRCELQKTEQMITLKNPLSEDLSIMRTSLLPRLLETAEKNLRIRKKFRLFESGKVFSLVKNKKQEEHQISTLLVGEDFFAAKEIVMTLAQQESWRGRLSRWDGRKKALPSYVHPGRAALFTIGKNTAIEIFEIHPDVAKEFGLPKPSSCFSLPLSSLAAQKAMPQKYEPIPRYQEIPFDVSVLCDTPTAVGELIHGLEKLDERIYDCHVMEVFEGKNVPEGKKSVTLSFEFRAPDRTLTDEERDEIWQILLKELNQRGAEFRFGG